MQIHSELQKRAKLLAERLMAAGFMVNRGQVFVVNTTKGRDGLTNGIHLSGPISPVTMASQYLTQPTMSCEQVVAHYVRLAEHG